MGTLTETDKNYLAQNFLAFFNRDYRRVAQVHIESGWVPNDTRVDDFEAAIRAVCEPIFARPLKEISFGAAAAPVPDLAPLQRRSPAAAGAAAEDAAQHRRPRARARPGPRPVGDRQALPRALDGRAGRLARLRRAPCRQEAPYWARRCPRCPGWCTGARAQDASGATRKRALRAPRSRPRGCRLAQSPAARALASRRVGAALLAGRIMAASWKLAPAMLIAFVVLYLCVTIAIGLWAAQRVHNSRDYVVAGRSLPLYINMATVFATWFGAETVLVGLRDVRQGRPRRRRRGPVRLVVLPGARGAVLRARVLPHGPADHRRLLPQALRQAGRGGHQPRHHRLLPGLDLGPAHRAGPRVLGAFAGRDLAERRHRARRGGGAGLHLLGRHVVGGAHGPVPVGGHHRRPGCHRLAGRATWRAGPAR